MLERDDQTIRRRLRRRRRRGGLSVVGVSSAVIAALVLSVLTTSADPVVEGPDLDALVEAAERWRSDFGSGRPAYRTEPPAPLSTSSAPAPVQSATLVSKTLRIGDEQVSYLVPDTALPYRYHVDRKLADRFGLDAVVDAVAQWDDIPGSRWATEFLSVVDHPTTRHRADGASVVYLRESCPAGYLGGAFWNHDPARAKIDVLYGTGAFYGSQVDVGVCTGIETLHHLRGVIAHEVGHALGLAHLCEPGEVCWRPGLDDSTHARPADGTRRCRAMYHLWGPCRAGVTAADHDALRHLYPTLPRLYGPTPAETAARVSYASAWTHTAPVVVLVPTDAAPGLLLGAAALSGALGAPLLLSEPDATGCVTGAGAEELARVAGSRARIHLVGTWPETCAEVLEGWGFQVDGTLADQDRPADPATVAAVAADVLTTAMVSAGREVTEVNVVPLDAEGVPPVDAAAAAAAVGRGIPMLITDDRRLAAPSHDFLARTVGIARASIAGGLDSTRPGVRAHIRALGVQPVRLAGEDPVDRSVLIDGRGERGAVATRQVVLTPATSWPEAAVGAALAARMGAPLLPVTAEIDPVVESWLQRHAPAGGFLVGPPELVPYPVQWAYTAHVRPAEDPVPSQATRGGWWTALPLVGE